eukprot:13534748-Alexandrium_andersonii.AAC.1
MRQDWGAILDTSIKQLKDSHSSMEMDAVDGNQRRPLTGRRLRWGKHKEGKRGKTKGKDRQNNKGQDTKNETVGHVGGHDESWVFGVFSSGHEQVDAVNSGQVEIMVDSGSCVNTCGWGQWNDAQNANLEPKELYGVDGKKLNWMGIVFTEARAPIGQELLC